MKTTDEELTIVPASLGDLEELLRIQKLAYEGEAKLYPEIEIPPMLQTLQELEQDFHDYVIYKALLAGTIIGSVRLKPSEQSCYIGKLAVHPHHQGCGFGRRMMRWIEEAYSGVEYFELFTGERSSKNIAFYERLGYQRFKEQAVNDLLTLVYMRKLQNR